MVSGAHSVCSNGKYIAIVSTTVETANPSEEVAAGIALLGPLLQRFDSVSPTYEPIGDGTDNRCFITKSYDATSHFETAADDVLEMYERLTGSPLDMTISADTTEAAE